MFQFVAEMCSRNPQSACANCYHHKNTIILNIFKEYEYTVPITVAALSKS
jgi:hypothetical protein